MLIVDGRLPIKLPLVRTEQFLQCEFLFCDT